MPRPRKYKNDAQRVNASKKANTERIVYDVRKDAKNNKTCLKFVADKLHNGSLTALIDAAVSQYLDGIKDPAIIAAVEAVRAAQAEGKSGGND